MTTVRFAGLGHALGLAAGPLVAMGMARFAYALLLPPMRADLQWTYTEAGAMNTANAVGYLAGAIGSAWIVSHVRLRLLFLIGIVLTAASVLACATTTSFALLAGLRLLGGVCGAITFVTGAALVMHAGAHLAAGPRHAHAGHLRGGRRHRHRRVRDRPAAGARGVRLAGRVARARVRVARGARPGRAGHARDRRRSAPDHRGRRGVALAAAHRRSPWPTGCSASATSGTPRSSSPCSSCGSAPASSWCSGSCSAWRGPRPRPRGPRCSAGSAAAGA